MILNKYSVFRFISYTVLSCLNFSLSAQEKAPSKIMEQQNLQNENSYPTGLLQISNTEAFAKYVLLVDKSKRKLFVFERDNESLKLKEELPTDIGKKSGNKTKRDDHRTPEGIYFFEQILTQPEIPFETYGSQAFTTNYPNIFDKLNGKTGSGIWLHSIPDSVPLTRGSRGCVVVRNKEIKNLGKYIELKQTPIIIYDELNFVTKKEHDIQREQMSQYIEEWRQAWESSNFEKYQNFYDPRFTAPGFKFENWIQHKKNLKSKYQYIKVKFSQPFILLHKNEMIIKTLQKYESDLHTDYGIKMIYALKDDTGKYKIIREEWTKAKENGDIAMSQLLDNSAE